MEHSWKCALVIGASSGIGRAMARELARQGVRVAMVARRQALLERLCLEINDEAGEVRALAFAHDVRDVEGAGALVQTIAHELGGLDLVVYAAGILPTVGPTQFSTDVDVQTIQTNFVGAVAWLNPVATRFAEARSGTIVGISSVAGDRGRRGNPLYNATKAALNMYLESLRNRLAVKGVRVLIAKPGYVRTPMLGKGKTPLPAATAEDTARAILDAAARGKRVLYTPRWWRIVSLGLRVIPAPLFERLPIP